jgi:hypothetical protein
MQPKYMNLFECSRMSICMCMVISHCCTLCKWSSGVSSYSGQRSFDFDIFNVVIVLCAMARILVRAISWSGRKWV